nr:MAG TPA: hypothetical protein [Crassvirales sp.]
MKKLIHLLTNPDSYCHLANILWQHLCLTKY